MLASGRQPDSNLPAAPESPAKDFVGIIAFDSDWLPCDVLSAFMTEQPLVMEKKVAEAERQAAEMQAKMQQEQAQQQQQSDEPAPQVVSPEQHAQKIMEGLQTTVPNPKQ